MRVYKYLAIYLIVLLLFVVYMNSGFAKAQTYNLYYYDDCDDLTYWNYGSGVSVVTYNGEQCFKITNRGGITSKYSFGNEFRLTIWFYNIMSDNKANVGTNHTVTSFGSGLHNLTYICYGNQLSIFRDGVYGGGISYTYSSNCIDIHILGNAPLTDTIYVYNVTLEANNIYNMPLPKPSTYNININGSFVYNGVPYNVFGFVDTYYNNTLIDSFACNNYIFNHTFNISRSFVVGNVMNFSLYVPYPGYVYSIDKKYAIIPFNISCVSGVYNYSYDFGVIEIGNASNYTFPAFEPLDYCNFTVSGYCYYNGVPIDNVTVYLEKGIISCYIITDAVGHYTIDTRLLPDMYFYTGIYAVYADDSMFTSPVYYINVVNNTSNYNVDINLIIKNNTSGDVFTWFKFKKIDIRNMWFNTLHLNEVLSVGDFFAGINVYIDQLNDYVKSSADYVVNNGINNYFSIFTSLLGNLLNVIPAKVYYVINLLIVMDIVMVVWRSV